MNKPAHIKIAIAVLAFCVPFFAHAAPKKTGKNKEEKKTAAQKQDIEQKKALNNRQEKPVEFWDKVAVCFTKNYREQHPDHFIPQMSDRQCNIFALQNAIPSIMNLDPNLMEFVIQKVASLHGKNLTIDLEGWSTSEIIQALTESLNRQVEAENKANGYDDESKNEKKKD